MWNPPDPTPPEDNQDNYPPDECEFCEGTGYVTGKVIYHTTWTYERLEGTCPKCEGTGYKS